MNPILQKYQTLTVVNAEHRARNAQRDLFSMSAYDIEQYALPNTAVGQIFLFPIPGNVDGPEIVMEVMVSVVNEDSLSTLYQPHPIFNDRASYTEAREEITKEAIRVAGAGDIGFAIKKCPARKRPAHCWDMPLAQLLDFIRIKTGSYH
jgi:hypothetical protein